MGFTRIDKDAPDIKVHEALPDIPTQTGSELKTLWDRPGEYLAEAINSLLNEIEGDGAVSGESGAKNIGVSNREEFNENTNIEDVLLYFRELIRLAVAGQIGDGDITENKIADSAITTNKIRDGVITPAKLSGGITKEKIVSVLSTAISGLITNEQLSGNISYDKLAGGIRATQLYGDIPLTKLANGYVIPVANGGTGKTTRETVTLDVTFKDGTTGTYDLVIG